TLEGFAVGDLVKIEVEGLAARVVQIAAFAGANQQTAVLNTLAALNTQTTWATVSRFHGIAAAGDVGTLALPVRIEMVNAPGQVSQLFGQAGGSLFLDLTGLFRGAGVAPLAHLDLLTAGADSVVTLHAGQAET